MIPISAGTGRLTWSKIPKQNGFELKSQAGLVGSLRRLSCWSSEFQAESLHGSWKFRRYGCFRPQTEILDATSGVQLASFKPNWAGGGTLVFGDGQTFQITSRGFWRPVWTVQADCGHPVALTHPREKTVDLPRQLPITDDRLTMLVMFAWYAQHLAAEDAASAAVVVAATS